MSSIKLFSFLAYLACVVANPVVAEALTTLNAEPAVLSHLNLPDGVRQSTTPFVYDTNQATKSLWLAAAAYCGKKEYESHVFQGPTTGFVWTKTIADAMDTQGYVGYLPSDKSIYVVFRGSQSLRNWITNLDAFKTNYTSYPECNCQVHKGFYAQEQNVIKGVINAVLGLKARFPTYKVKVTGHSLGAALAQLTSMDLIKAGFPNTIYNFGQPRVGDQAYANFATKKLSIFRVTHNKDVVPHVPPSTKMAFYHVCTEQYEDAYGAVSACTNGCEDPNCADQWALRQTNIDDHLIYLGKYDIDLLCILCCFFSRHLLYFT